MKKPLLILALAIWWHLLAWEAAMGLNVLLFSLSIALAIPWLKPQAFARREVKYLLAAWCISGFMVFLQNSILSMVIYWFFAFILLGYLQEIRVRFWIFGIIESISALFGGWWISIRHLGIEIGARHQIVPTWQNVRLVLLPLLVVIPFYIIYSQANTKLGAFNDHLTEWWSALFQFEQDWSRIIIFLLGWALVTAFLGRRIGAATLHNWTATWTYQLQRKCTQPYWSFNFKTLGLKQEYQSALLTFTSLNILLAIINTLDISFVWFSRQARTAAELSAYVHEGTWLLILSIILAMLVVLGFFRGNLNFLQENKRLRQLAYLWLGQNALLALSVGVRNGHYINHYALAHGRIVVVFFLLLVLFGLYTMYRKVRYLKTLYYLLQTNAAAIMVALLLAASINWDSLITRYNLGREQPDLYYLTIVMENNLTPLLQAAQSSTMLADQLDTHYVRGQGEQLAYNWKSKDWRSWNWSEYRQYQAWQAYLNSKK